MLQSTEYKLVDFWSWYKRVKSFKEVEYRKKLQNTKKALLLLGIAHIVNYSIYLVSLVLIFKGKVLLAFGFFILSPFLTLFLLLVALFLIKNLIQKPLEQTIIHKAANRIKQHQGLRIAIAGSYGKTSMREILKTILSEGKRVDAPPNSYNTLLGISRFIEKLKGDEEIIIFELGEYYPGDIKELCELTRPDIGIITGINEAHLSKFKNIKHTANTIYELADYLKENKLYVNGESELAKEKSKEGDILYSREAVNDWRVENAKTSLSGTRFILEKGAQRIAVESRILGLHNVGPLALGCIMALDFGLNKEQIQAGVKKTHAYAHRMEPRVNSEGVVIIDDSYNGNPTGVKAVIDFLRSLSGRRFYVTPGLVEMGDKTEEIHNKIGEWLAKAQIEKVLLIKNSVTPAIERGLINTNYTGEIIWFDSGPEAFAALPNLTVKGDIVLLQNDWPDQYY